MPGPEPVCEQDSLSPVAPFRVVNIGASQPTPLMEYIAALEAALGITAEKNMMEMQAGDVPATWADTSLLTRLTGYAPQVSVQGGRGPLCRLVPGLLRRLSPRPPGGFRVFATRKKQRGERLRPASFWS